MRKASLIKNKKNIVVAIFSSLGVWLVLLVITHENNLPSDGSAYLGFPVNFLTISHDPFTGKYDKLWDFAGIIYNIGFLIIVFSLAYYLLKKVRNRKLH